MNLILSKVTIGCQHFTEENEFQIRHSFCTILYLFLRGKNMLLSNMKIELTQILPHSVKYSIP